MAAYRLNSGRCPSVAEVLEDVLEKDCALRLVDFGCEDTRPSTWWFCPKIFARPDFSSEKSSEVLHEVEQPGSSTYVLLRSLR
jgi:hypothetical protein